MSSQALTGISYVVLKSGEHIIAFVTEVIKGDSEDTAIVDPRQFAFEFSKISRGYLRKPNLDSIKTD